MSKPYASGEIPRVGDEVDLGSGNGPRGMVVVVVGGPTHGASEGFEVTEWEYLSPGLLIQTESIGLVYDKNPDDEVILIKRSS